MFRIWTMLPIRLTKMHVWDDHSCSFLLPWRRVPSHASGLTCPAYGVRYAWRSTNTKRQSRLSLAWRTLWGQKRSPFPGRRCRQHDKSPWCSHNKPNAVYRVGENILGTCKQGKVRSHVVLVHVSSNAYRLVSWRWPIWVIVTKVAQPSFQEIWSPCFFMVAANWPTL